MHRSGVVQGSGYEGEDTSLEMLPKSDVSSGCSLPSASGNCKNKKIEWQLENLGIAQWVAK